jgi:predicted DCC family thiol-disulfide oxidoreductase YuxK
MSATFVYDGDCAFCTSCAQFAQRRVPTDATIAAWQFTDIGALGLTENQCDEAVQWVDTAGGAPLAGPRAIAALLRSSNRRWRLVGWLLDVRPVRAVAWPAYRWVARNRHRMPGGTAACAVPHAQRQAWQA